MSIVNRSQIDTVFTQKYKNNKFEVVGPIDWDYFNVINKITKQLHEIYLTADDTMTEVNKNDRIKFTERIFNFDQNNYDDIMGEDDCTELVSEKTRFIIAK